MGRAIALADVRLDLDDPTAAAARGIVPDQAGTDQRTGRNERRTLQAAPLDDAQLDG
jgi:hypothetical protein